MSKGAKDKKLISVCMCEFLIYTSKTTFKITDFARTAS